MSSTKENTFNVVCPPRKKERLELDNYFSFFHENE